MLRQPGVPQPIWHFLYAEAKRCLSLWFLPAVPMPSIRGMDPMFGRSSPWFCGLHGSTPGSVGRTMGWSSPTCSGPILVLNLVLLSLSSVAQREGIRLSDLPAGGTSSTMSGSLSLAPTWSNRQSLCLVIVRQRAAPVLRSCLIAWHSMHPRLANSGARFLSRFAMDREEFVLVACAPTYSRAVPIRTCLVSRTKCCGQSASVRSPMFRSGVLLGGYT